MKIFVVDDDRAARRSIKLLLVSYGHTVADFSNGRDMLRELAAHQDACVILDYAMPDLDGVEVLLEMRRRNFGNPVIFITGHGQEEVKGLAGDQAVDVLAKPCPLDKLFHALANSEERLG